MTFDPKEHLIALKTRQGSAEYLPVQWRLVWFRLECPNGTIETEIIHLDPDKETEEETYVWNNETRKSEKVIKTARGLAIVRATVKDGKGGVAMGTKMEKAASFGDWLEKAETGSIGRALAALGYGTQFTGDEFDERHRIVDAPVENTAGTTTTFVTNTNHTTSAKSAASALVPTVGTTYKRGLVTKAWTEKDFYAAASAILGNIPVARDTALTAEQLKKLAEAAEQGPVEMAANA